MDYLSAAHLMRHVRALAETIGPRPPGSRAEMQARQYVRHALADAGITEDIEEQSFTTPDTLGYAALIPLSLSILGNLLPFRKLGGLVTLFNTWAAFQLFSGRRQPYTFLTPSSPSANLIVRIPPKGKVQRKVVLIGHLDTNKHRTISSPAVKRGLVPLATSALVIAVLNGIAQLFGFKRLRTLTTLSMIGSLGALLLDESGDFVAGANDNASAVACLLGIGGQLQQNPLENTEVWLAFTGSEETVCLGMQELLDTYREELADAYFVDLEMVGAGDIAYVTHHSSMTYLSAYQPDPESLAWAQATAAANPDLNVTGTPMTILEEVATLRSRGFRGLCIVGVGEDGWLVNWHQYADNASNIEPQNLEKAARFTWAMLQNLDERS